MEYIVKNFQNTSSGFNESEKIKELTYTDTFPMIGDNGDEISGFSFDIVFEDTIWAGFQIGLKEVIYLRNALNSFIEIQNSTLISESDKIY